MRLSQRQGLFGGLALLACAAFALGILFTRLTAALFGPPLAILAAAVPLLGGVAGGILVSVAPSVARPPRLFARLAYLACIASALTIIAVITSVQPRWNAGAPALPPGSV